MAAGHAQRVYDTDPSKGPVAICDHLGKVRSHDLWRHNPVVALQDQTYPQFRAPQTRFVQNAKFCRPYIVYPFTDQTGWVWSPTWKARDHRGRLFLSDSDHAVGLGMQVTFGRYLLIEPTPIRGNKNRRWPDEKWIALAEALKSLGVPILQLKHSAARMLPDTIPVPHQGFREACGVVNYATLFVATEGGLVHASAALGTPTVALWGGCVSEPVLGYPEHVNLVDDAPETPCGTWKPCPHCIAAWDRLTAEQVYTATVAKWKELT